LQGFVEEPGYSFINSISSARPTEEADLQAEPTAGAPTPEFLRQLISPAEDTHLELDPSINRNSDLLQDWFSGTVHDARNQTPSTTTFFPDFVQQPLTPHPAPVIDPSLSSSEVNTVKMVTKGQEREASSKADDGCTCTAECLSLIPELQQYSAGRSKLTVNEILSLTRRASSIISNHFDCLSDTRTQSTQTSLLGCILAMMQITACYASLRKSLENPEMQNRLLVSFDGLAIEENETRHHIFNVIIKAEISKAAGITSKLEEWRERLETSSDTSLPWQLLLISVKQELDRL
jgi:hypothetical protein